MGMHRISSHRPTCRVLACSEEALNTGILCEGLRIVDVDVDDAAKAAEIERLAQQYLPPGALIRRRSNSPRFALVYRAAEGAPRKRKIGIGGRAVEVLGAGQQLVVHGVHSTGVLIEWDNGRSPATTNAMSQSVTSEGNLNGSTDL
jgi:hypothetical protein